MSKKFKTWEDWAKAYYGQLVGYTIKEFKIEDNSEVDDGYTDDQFPVFVLEKKGYKDIKISVSQDEEGNGSGFLFIEDNKQ